MQRVGSKELDMEKYIRILKAKWFLFGVGLVIGALIILGIRFTTYKPEEPVHYHANFAVFVDGEREQFKGMQYYEETEASSCSLEHVESPAERAHMHSNVNDVVHVEDHLVTWGHFMQNLHFDMGDDFLKTPDKVYTNGDQGKMSFMLNGQKVDSVEDKIIQDKDKLLVSFGNETEDQLQQQYNTIPDTATQYDTAQDPASCSGNKMQKNDRMRHLF